VRNNLAIALTDLGTQRKRQGDAAGGVALYERALALAPHYADALYNLGVALAEAGPCQSLDRALFYYHTAASVRPECAEA
jgi:tetratricopeptide (TPR) repeat protein